MVDIVPNYTTPRELAEKLGASPRFVGDTIRQLGCFCKIGQKVIMLDHHVVAFMEAMECHSTSPSGARSGTTQGQLPEGDFEALRKHRTKTVPPGLRRKSKRKLGDVILMDQARH